MGTTLSGGMSSSVAPATPTTAATTAATATPPATAATATPATNTATATRSATATPAATAATTTASATDTTALPIPTTAVTVVNEGAQVQDGDAATLTASQTTAEARGLADVTNGQQASTAAANGSESTDALLATAPATTTTATHSTDAVVPVGDTNGAALGPVHADSTATRSTSADQKAVPAAIAEEEEEEEEEHGEGGAALQSHNEVESSTSTVRYRRKKRRQAVTEYEDMAIFRAIAQIQPHRAPWGETKRRWLQVVDAVVAETGTKVEVTRMLCQRRYEILLARFLTKRELHQNWPPNPDMRVLLEAAVEERKAREDENRSNARKSHPTLSMSALRAALASANGGSVSLVPNVEGRDGNVKQESKVASADGAREVVPTQDGHGDSTPKVDVEMDDLFGDIPASRSPTKRRSYVESTVVAVLDRLADMEKTWLENAREERALKRQKLEMEIEQRKTAGTKRKRADDVSEDLDMESDESSTTATDVANQPAPVATNDGDTATQTKTAGDCGESSRGIQNGDAIAQPTITILEPNPTTETAGVAEAATPTEEKATNLEMSQTEVEETGVTRGDTRATVSQEAVEALKCEVSMLSSSIVASQQTNKQLTDQVAMLSTVLNDVRVEKDVLKQDVATLQALLRDAASLAGTLRVLRESHQQHEQKFETYTLQQDARIDALKREVKERHQLVRDQLAPLNNASGANKQSELLASIQHEREQMQAEHAKRLAELDQKMKALEHPVAELRETVDKQQSRLNEAEEKVKSVQASHAKVDNQLNQIKAEIESDRKERQSEYGTLLRTVEQVAAGKARLI